MLAKYIKLTFYDFLAFIASSFRVTEEDLLSETDLSGPLSFFECFTAIKGIHLYILLGAYS